MRLALLILLCCYLTCGRADPPVPVLVVHSYSEEYPWTKGQQQGFMEVLNNDLMRRYSVKVEDLDTKRMAYTPAYADLTATYLRDKYQGYQPKAIYVSDDNALKFAQSHLRKLFPETPVFFSGINDLAVRDLLDPNRFTGVFEIKEIAPNLRLLHELAPDTRDIVIVGDASETDRAITAEIQASLTDFPEFRATFISRNHIDELIGELRQRKERFVLLTTLGAVRDSEDRNLTLNETISAITAAGDFVVLSMEDAYMLPGVLGGYVTSGPAQGRAAGQMLQRYFDGAAISDLPPIEASPNEYILDELELTREKLQLPDSIKDRARLINDVPTYYETNRSTIVSALYALFGLLLLSSSGWLMFVRKNRQIAQITKRLVRAQHIARLGSWEWHIEANRLFWSEEVYRLFGISPTEREQTYEVFLTRVFPDDRQAVKDATRNTLDRGEAYDFDHRIVQPGGDIRFVHQSAELIYDSAGKPISVIGTTQDITDRKLAEQILHKKDAHLDYLAYHDSMTGLSNRTQLVERLQEAAKRCDRTGKLLALLLIDLDRFKTINDSLGHVIGDALLRAAANRLKATAANTTDIVSRFGGDEFMILVQNLEDRGSAVVAAQRILALFEEPFDVAGHHLHVSCSIGISLYPLDGLHAATLVMNADAAMYRAKDSGRNCFYFYESSITERVAYRMRMEVRLRAAFEDERLEVYYQPLVQLGSGHVCGVEALLRWNDPLEGAIPPDEFIPLTEETGMIISLGEWVVKKACRALKGWQDRGVVSEDFAMHINLSGKQLARRDLPQKLRQILSEAGVAPAGVVLELTESSISGSEGDSCDQLTALRDIGISIAIDDFGTGHSSLSRLKQLPISELKIDRSFVQDIQEDAEGRAIVQAILTLASSLKLRVVAEGIESVEQERVLVALGCNIAQGYYYGQPMPEPELLSLFGEAPSGTRHPRGVSAA